MDEPSSSLLRSMNWAGSIPIILSLAPSSLSSPTMPPPIHRMVSRMVFLHLGLRDAVIRFYKFAPAVQSFPPQQQQQQQHNECSNNENMLISNNKEYYPVCWFEDVETGEPLRWHLFVGILYDLLQSSRVLPWKIRIHFTSYPSHQILDFSNKDTIKSIQLHFLHSLKQALYLQFGSSKKQMNINKRQYELLWNSMNKGGCRRYEMYQDVNIHLQQLDRSSLLHVPVRVMFNSKPMIQKPMKLVLRNSNSITLGSILVDFLPQYFYQSTYTTNTNDVINIAEISYSHHNSCYWAIQGIQPSMESDIIDLWSALSCPDHFLYITVTIPNIII